MGKKWCVAILIAVGVLLTAFVVVPYARVEILTALHGKELETCWRETGMFDGVALCKVFSYRNDAADVYFVDDDRECGFRVIAERDGDGWRMREWKTVWSTNGSADDFIWPYYR